MDASNPLLRMMETTEDVVLKILAWINCGMCIVAIVGKIVPIDSKCVFTITVRDLQFIINMIV